jgi:alpha-galactosidase
VKDKMKTETIATFEIADTALRYVRETESGRVGIELYPTQLADARATRRGGIGHQPYIAAMPDAGDLPAWRVDPLVHVKLVGDAYPAAFAQGRTMRVSPSIDRFQYEAQEVMRDGDRTAIVTKLRSADDLAIEHRLSWHAGEMAAEIATTFRNSSARTVTLEMLTSFSLGGITPFASDDAPGRLRVHRFRSVWSAEARLETRSIEQLHLERSWSGAGAFSERFGQIGSMPVRGWFPFVAVEDTAAGVTWGANLAWAGSWQMEIFRQHDVVCLSGGLADREFGHWMKTLPPGESITTPTATIACVRGDLDDLCDRLTAPQHRAADAHPSVERDLPIVFNEWCTTWGDPRHDKAVEIAECLRGTDTRYLVIDAGWYKGERGDWGNAHGDWNASPQLFPKGLEATATAIRERGLVPGLWFEMETVGDASVAFSLIDHLLKRDGLPITVRHRRFWDLSDPFVVRYLSEKVIDQLERGGFGYLKVDYNETIGIGCDHPDGQGEGLRRHIEGVYRFFDRIRQRLPNLVIESCSSGGHRLEPSMLARSAMSSFSDAHELIEIPIIAASLHRLMLPRQSQIWAVLHANDSDRRLEYSLAATFLGRMCVSGEVDRLSAHQQEILARAIELYRRAAPIIRNGLSRCYSDRGDSWRHPVGWQGVLRMSTDGRRALAVFHAFAGAPAEVSLPLPQTRVSHDRPWHVVASFGAAEHQLIEPAHLYWRPGGDYAGAAILLER